MGGENEITTPKKSAPGAPNPSGLRVHINGGEAHFHDDTGRLKTAVPVSVWYKYREELITLQRPTWEYLDPVNETLLTLNMIMTDNGGGETHEIDQVVKKVNIGPTLKAMAVHMG